MRHCADDDDYDGRRMELEGGRERDSRATGKSGGEGNSASVLKRGRERESAEGKISGIS